jgi:octaprenyl-diphosphate synthase
VNAQWGSPTAVLGGDFFHDRALVTIFENGNSEVMRLFLKTAGIVCDGEIHELRRVRFYDLTEVEYFEIIYKKTASLLACVLEAGGRIAGASENEAKALAEFGRHFGNAFQMIDDCLDFTANQAELGKTLGTDLAAGVLTLPLIRLLETRPDLKSTILDLIEQSASRENLQQLSGLIFENGAMEYVFKRAHESTQQALLSLAFFPESPARQSLEKLAGYILERTK